MSKRKEAGDTAGEATTGAEAGPSTNTTNSSTRGGTATAMPTRCRVIEFTNGEGTTGPAIVTAVERVDAGGAEEAPAVYRMNVCLFDPVMGPRNYYVQDVAASMRPSPGEPDTWNWPVRG